MEQIGWALVDSNGAEIQFWGDAAGACAGLPNPLFLPNGDHVHGGQPGQIGSWHLVERHIDYGASEGKTYDGSKVVVTKLLADYKATLKSKVSVDAETCRQRFITPGSGKAMTYLEKHNQANAVHDLGQEAANALSETDRRTQFPTLSASVGIEADTLYGCALLIISRYEAWATISYNIERAEISGKKAISDASDAASAKAAYEAITWPTP